MTSNTVGMVEIHICLSGTILQAHIFEHISLVFFQMTGATIFILGYKLGVGVMQELHCGHYLAPGYRWEVNHQDIRSVGLWVCLAVNTRNYKKHTHQKNYWNDALAPSTRSSVCHITFLY
jgi:hypothetical protein